MKTEATVIMDSVCGGKRITTIQGRFPRGILAQFNTHGRISRSAQSSRATPIQKRISSVRDSPFLPKNVRKNQRGMQGYDFVDDEAYRKGVEAIERHRDHAVATAKELMGLGWHKQSANLYLSPFLYQDVVATATEWDNFINLRVHHASQPEMQEFARCVRDAIGASTPVARRTHAPYLTVGEANALNSASLHSKLWWMYINRSAARCARTSYRGFDGKVNVEADAKLARALLASHHMSPFEHQAICLQGEPRTFEHESNLEYPWVQARKMLRDEDVFHP